MIALNDLGSGVDTDGRRLLADRVYSAAALILPDETWWDAMAQPSPRSLRRANASAAETPRPYGN